MKRTKLDKILRTEGSSHAKDLGFIVRFYVVCAGEWGVEETKDKKKRRQRKGTLVCLMVHSSHSLISLPLFVAKLFK